jgi:cation/acetate symporter
VIVPDRSDSTVSLNNLSLNIGLTLGIMGLPHVMVRFLTVRDARAARTSALVAMGIFSVFFLMLPLFGYAALNEVGRERIIADNPAGNAAGPRLAEIVGGDVVFAIVAGVTITTILAVLAGLAIAASGAIAHDLYTNVIKRGDVAPERQLWVGRAVGVGIAVVAILLALGAKDLNIAFLANVAFAIAASTTMPVLLLTIYWRRFNSTGATAGLIGGLTVALVLVLLGPDVLGKDDAIFPLSIPAIVSVPAGFLCAWLGTLAGRGRHGATGMPYDEFVRRAFPARAARFARGGGERAGPAPGVAR